jgi:hypothetical protein
MYGAQVTQSAFLSKKSNNFETKQYIFPHHGYLAGIIDFSRSFMHQSRLMNDTNIEMSQRQFAINEQNNRVINVIKIYFPEIAAKIIHLVPAYLQSASESDEYNYIFKLMTTYDIFLLFSQFRDYLKTFPHLQRHSEFLASIALEAESYLKLHLSNISIHMDKNYMKEFLNEKPFPMQIMEKFFSQYDLSKNDEISLVPELHYKLGKEKRDQLINLNENKTVEGKDETTESDFTIVEKIGENETQNLTHDSSTYINIKESKFPPVTEADYTLENSKISIVAHEIGAPEEVMNSDTVKHIRKIEPLLNKLAKPITSPFPENETFKEYFKHELLNPITGNILPIDHPAINICPGYHFNNILRGNYVFKIVDIFNQSENNVIKDNLNFYIPRYSIDGDGKEQIKILEYVDFTRRQIRTLGKKLKL